MHPAKKNIASELARSYGLQRAKERAKSPRPSSSPDRRWSTSEASKNIDVLYGITRSLHLTDSPSSLLIDEVTSSEKTRENLTVSLMKKHFSAGIIWDQEFPSMCSYGSDCDPSKSPGHLSESVLVTPNLDPQHMNEHSQVNNLDAYSDLEICCTNQPLQIGSCNMIQQEDGKIYNPDLLQEHHAAKNRADDKSQKRRRSRNNISMSASIPSDVHGIVAESIAVVKVSYYPYEEFRESIVQMLGNSKIDLMDLEELLYSYFSLNLPENYDLIREAFFDAWNQLLCYHGIPLDLL